MNKQQYMTPETEVILVRIESVLFNYNQDFNEDNSDDDFFGDDNN